MPTILQRIGKILMYPFLNTLCSTIKIKKINNIEYENFRKTGKPFILVFWHGTMLMVWFSEKPKTNEKIFSFASKSPDGEMAIRTFENWGFEFVRGSSRNGSEEVKKTVSEKILEGYPLFVVPDGPTGPNRKLKFGALSFAQKYSVPIFLVAVKYSRKKIFKSWDKFELPAYFSTCLLNFSNAIYIDKKNIDLTETKVEIENLFSKLQFEVESVN